MKSLINSKIYLGNIIHRRLSPKKHSFNYSLYMLALDPLEMEQQQTPSWLFGFAKYYPLGFIEKDYIRGEPGTLEQRIKDKVTELADNIIEISSIMMLVQVRCFGIYFSPANFYFCYDQNKNCTHMLAEVSNTPWNERHYYLVDLQTSNDKVNEKYFQVSPFMDLNMSYFWKVKPPTPKTEKLVINIENQRENLQSGQMDKIFDVNLVMRKKEFTKVNLLGVWCQLPLMTIKVVFSIYWQALKLFIKGIPFIGYQTKLK